MQCVIYYDLRCLSVDFFFFNNILQALNQGQRTRGPFHILLSVSLSPPPLQVLEPTEYTLLLTSLNDLRWRVVEDVNLYPISNRAVITDKTKERSISLLDVKICELA